MACLCSSSSGRAIANLASSARLRQSGEVGWNGPFRVFDPEGHGHDEAVCFLVVGPVGFFSFGRFETEDLGGVLCHVQGEIHAFAIVGLDRRFPGFSDADLAALKGAFDHGFAIENVDGGLAQMAINPEPLDC